MKRQSTDTADINVIIDQFNKADFALMMSVQAGDREAMVLAADSLLHAFENLMSPVLKSVDDRATLANFLCDRFVFSENRSHGMLRSAAAKLVELASFGDTSVQAVS